ncbi:hypothetical protein [Mucilaginibacter sp. KACC 22063]|uniref:hypothetical protein n=1 Tax=Mucilaginibacter sp. KACC 22063 TaxID=3025666 RepID=UPI00236669D2|nr:hypothetical protein [Mucilaginibacter sp. KACC 22063]WDF56531.1 hypothetical protein PQ461_05640 [Mucilaginibacter sp. KACC 22063]
MPEKQLSRIIFATLILLTVIAGIAVYLHPMALFPDPSWGFQVMRSMERGGGFNMLINPDHDNIAHNYGEFLSWWSPGQYLVPYFFKTILHINTGRACAVTVFLCEVIGLLGLYRFFRKAGFSNMVSVVSLAFIACQQFYVLPYVFYNGGEVLLFAFSGWFLYGCLSFNKPNDWRLILFILLSGWVGFICKSSFVWMFAAGLLVLWIRLSRNNKSVGKWIINGIWLGVPAVLSLIGIYTAYLSKGTNPTSGSNNFKLVWETLTFPLASPLLSGFSIDELSNGLIYHNDTPVFSYTGAIIILLLTATASIYLIVKAIKTIPNTDYQVVLASFYVVSVLFFSFAFFRQSAISYEARHFRMMGLIFIPAAIYLVSRLKFPFRIVFGAVWAFILFKSLGYLISGYSANKNEGVHAVSGLTQQFIDKESIQDILHLDSTEHNATFVFNSPDLALEIEHNRVITIDPIGPNMKIDFEAYTYKGFGGPLHIMLPSSYRGARMAMILKCFPGYKAFKYQQLSTDYFLLSSSTPRD